MNCLSDKEMQEYMDDEAADLQTIKNHLKDCAECTAKLKEIKRFSQELIDEYNRSFDEVEIPEFVIPQKTKSKKRKSKIRILYQATAAAAILILFTLYISIETNKKQIPEQIIYYELEFEVDANKPLHEQNMDMIIYDNSTNQSIGNISN